MKRVLIGLVLSISSAVADPSDYLVRVSGRENATVTRSDVRLSDIADVEAMKPGQDDTIIGIKKIIIGEAPKPGESLTFQASDILSRIQDEGFTLSRIGYTFPRSISIRRAARVLSNEEIMNALTTMLQGAGRDATIKNVSFAKPIMVSPGQVSLMPRLVPSGTKGIMKFDVDVSVDGKREGTFNVDGATDEWVTLPVAASRLEKGSIIDESTVQMARVNFANLPLDAENESNELMGKKVMQTIEPGIPFRKSQLAKPVMVAKGSKVILQYAKGSLQATASGIAMQDGVAHGEIKVKNDASQRVISGWVIEPGLVSVTYPGEMQ